MRGGQRDLQCSDTSLLPPIQLSDLGGFHAKADQVRAHPKRNHIMLEAVVKTADGCKVEVIVVVVADQHDINAGELSEVGDQ